MSIFSWCSRRMGGLSLLSLLSLCFYIISTDLHNLNKSTRSLGTPAGVSPDVPSATDTATGPSSSTILFACYSLLIHILVVVFPIRACWATWDITCSLRRIARLRRYKESKHRRSSSSFSSSAETLTPGRSFTSSASSDAGDVESGYLGDVEVEPPKNIHAILIPNYKEEIDVLEETLNVLASHPLARSEYDIYLAMESREADYEAKALEVISDFVKSFRFIGFTVHPSDIPNEAPGKSSNIAWAATKASERYQSKARADVTITVIDADSHLSLNYFEQINSMRLAHQETAPNTLYSAPIVFDRNAHLVPSVVRVADVLWGAAGMSGLYAGSSIRPPTSVYSLPLVLADKVGGWDTDSGAIGEDLHMYLKCFFALNGNLTTRTVLAPVSQTNVSSNLKGVRGQIDGCRARYKQALRHMWGALDSGYALRSLVSIWRDRNVLVRTYGPLHGNANSTKLYNSDLPPQGIFSDLSSHGIPSPNYFRIISLLHRLFEAHFLPTHMAILTIASSLHLLLQPQSFQLQSSYLASTFQLTAFLRILGFLLVAVYMALYESFHSFCVASRRAEMQSAGIQKGRLGQAIGGEFSERCWKTNWVDYGLIPLVAPLFGSIPAAQAQFMHFWTGELVYAVSRKPERENGRVWEKEDV